MWTLSNRFLEDSIKAHRSPDYLAQLNTACQSFQNEVERDIELCKNSVKRAADVLVDDDGIASAPREKGTNRSFRGSPSRTQSTVSESKYLV
jgi:hypothetical protein